MADFLFVAFQRPPRGLLATKPQPDEQMPDMAGMVTHPTAILNQARQTRERPNIGVMAGSGWTGQNDLGQFLLLRPCQPGLASRRAFALEANAAMLFPALPPGVNGLPFDTQPPGHFAGGDALVKQGHGFEPSLFHRRMIALLCHAPFIPQPKTVVSLFYEYL